MPSGLVEKGQARAVGAARELAEESGCLITPADLELFAVAEVWHRGTLLSTSWNFTATTTEARFERAEAFELISHASFAPQREPFLRFLTADERNVRWSFELVEPDTNLPLFRYAAAHSG